MKPFKIDHGDWVDSTAFRCAGQRKAQLKKLRAEILVLETENRSTKYVELGYIVRDGIKGQGFLPLRRKHV